MNPEKYRKVPITCGYYIQPRGVGWQICTRPATHSVAGMYCCEAHIIMLVGEYLGSGKHDIDIRLESDAYELEEVTE